MPSDGVPYPIFSYAALVPWTFLSNALATATIGLVSQRSIVTKTYFPRELLVVAADLRPRVRADVEDGRSRAQAAGRADAVHGRVASADDGPGVKPQEAPARQQ